MPLSREEILARKLRTEVVAVPEWGGEVIVRELSAAHREEYEAWLSAQYELEADQRDRKGRAKIAAMSVIGEDGKSLFTAADVVTLSEASGAALGRIAEKAFELSGIGQKAVEDAVKN